MTSDLQTNGYFRDIEQKKEKRKKERKKNRYCQSSLLSVLFFFSLQIMDPVTREYQDNGFINVTYTSIKTINRSLKTFYCTLYSFLKDVDGYGKSVQRSQGIFGGVRFHGFVTHHLDVKSFCDKSKLENCIITKEFCWNHVHAQIDSFMHMYMYYRDSLIATAEIRYKVVARVKEMHYLIWGISNLISYSHLYRTIVLYLDRIEEEMSEKWTRLFDYECFHIEFCMFEVKVRNFLIKIGIPPYTNLVLEDDNHIDFLRARNVENMLQYARRHGLTDC